MEIKEAIQILSTICANAQMVLADHQKAQQALQAVIDLSNSTEEPKEKPPCQT